MNEDKIHTDDFPRGLPFEVPDGYFDRLPSVIQARIPVTPVKKPFITWSWQRSLVTTMAMSVLALLVWVTYPETQGALGSDPLSGLSDEAIIAYLDQQNVNFYDLSEHKEVRGAFATDSTIMNYLDGINNDFIKQQVDENDLLLLDAI